MLPIFDRTLLRAERYVQTLDKMIVLIKPGLATRVQKLKAYGTRISNKEKGLSRLCLWQQQMQEQDISPYPSNKELPQMLLSNMV